MEQVPEFISQLPTPCCLIEKQKLQRNIARLSNHIGQLGCQIRPHVKTHKSIDVTREIINGGNVKGITVSTLREAQHFFEHGFSDILYAVGITPNKLEQVAQLMQSGCDIKIVLDNPDMANLILQTAQQLACTFKIMIELDTDGHRSGVDPKSDELIEIAKMLEGNEYTQLIGVMTHAGESYACFTHESKLAMAKQERDLSLLAAERLRQAGYACDEVSIGSSPTAHAIDNLDGITEVRAGVYVFFDLVMSGLQVCNQEDIAMSVLASVIGYQKDKNWVITDAGWMAMSRDRGTQSHSVDQGYGVVRDQQGKLLGDYIVNDANQEHGIVRHRDPNHGFSIDAFPLAGKVRVLPNHACSTAAQFDHFIVVDQDRVIAQWPSVRGW
ncbi:alanine racemase [Aliiglaciecola sp.]|nr:alanine racemase [Aliiglaciecola sp.]